MAILAVSRHIGSEAGQATRNGRRGRRAVITALTGRQMVVQSRVVVAVALRLDGLRGLEVIGLAFIAFTDAVSQRLVSCGRCLDRTASVIISRVVIVAVCGRVSGQIRRAVKITTEIKSANYQLTLRKNDHKGRGLAPLPKVAVRRLRCVVGAQNRSASL